MYALPEAFKINGFEKWFPAYGKPNSKKSVRLFGPSPAVLTWMTRTRDFAAKSEMHARRASRTIVLFCLAKMSDEEKIAWIMKLVLDGSLRPAVIRDAIDG